ncbi:MAG: CBS domain-containing protein [Azospirillum sp.]|nr:CBS domain-containing protein [Azospirillum sp.]
MKIATVLTTKGSEIVSLPPSATIAAAAKVLNDNGIGALVVRDGDGSLRGILSERDIVHAIADLGTVALKLTIKDLMTRDVKTCTPRDDVKHVTHLMNTLRVRHVPVVEDNDLVGIISVRDVVNCQLAEHNEEIAMYLTMARCRPLSVGLHH